MIEAVSERERTWASSAHFTVLLNLIGAPVLGPIGALVMYQMSTERGPFARNEAREALNYQITYAIVSGLAFACAMYAWSSMFFGAMNGTLRGGAFPPGFAWFFGCIVVMMLVTLVTIVGGVAAGIRANGGTAVRYPFILRFVR